MKKLVLIVMIAFVGCGYSSAQIANPNAFCRCDTLRIVEDSVDKSLITYSPVNASLNLCATRPDTNDENIVFCVPAAFTAKNYSEIVGRFVGMDTVIENPTEKETGLCVIDGRSVYIGDIADSLMYYHHALQSGRTGYFQQMLLINNATAVPCTIFGKQKPTFRRSLAVRNGEVCVAESLNRMNIDDFTNVMIAQGFDYAIYLDMGTWSEGYYFDENGRKYTIGALRQNTRYQTNWLIFVAEREKR